MHPASPKGTEPWKGVFEFLLRACRIVVASVISVRSAPYGAWVCGCVIGNGGESGVSRWF